MSKTTPGVVYLIGAGPGDPGLMTLRGAQILAAADVVVYDRLAHPHLLKLAGANAEHVYVGKASSNHAMRQPEINKLLVERALLGLTVARLKGGDPLVFGRGGEEAEYCRDRGVRFEIVPGVTSAIAAPAYAGIPVTHRDAASSFAVITGHERDDESSPAGSAEGRRNWKQIAFAADTLVFLMGVENLSEITNRLIEHGRDPETPVGLIQWGTWPLQRVVTGTLATIVDTAKRNGISSPAVCIVGEVVRMRDKLRWFDNPEQRPLFGKRILVTRAREQASALVVALTSLGADPVEFPTIRVVQRALNAELESALHSLNQYCWILFTSTNAVNALADALFAAGLDGRAFSGVRVAAIGPTTSQTLMSRLAIRPDYIPSDAVAESVLREWPDSELTNKRILLPCGAEARDVLPVGLSKLGAIVDVVHVYDTVLEASGTADLRGQLEAGSLDALTFTSSSTVSNFVQALGSPEHSELERLIGGCLVAAIGPVTAQTLADYGILAGVTATDYTIHGLVAGLTAYFQQASHGA